MSEKLRVSDLLQVKGEMDFLAVEATVASVSEVRERVRTDGGKFTAQEIVLADNGSVITACLISRPPFPKEGAGKRFSFVSCNENGALYGLKIKMRDVYKKDSSGAYVKQEGQKEVVVYVSSKAVINPATNLMQSKPTPAQTNPEKKYIPNGITAGMVMNNACASVRNLGLDERTEEGEAALHHIATVIMRVTHKIEHGNFYKK